MTINPKNITHWVLRADQPYRGFSQSFLLPDGTVGFTNGLTPEQYEKERGFPVRIVTSEELDRLDEGYIASMITDPIEESAEDFDYALDVLPPCKWRHVDGVELFHVSESITGTLVSWHARCGDRYFCMTHHAHHPLAELAILFAKAARDK